jgi:hypothetical protein
LRGRKKKRKGTNKQGNGKDTNGGRGKEMNEERREGKKVRKKQTKHIKRPFANSKQAACNVFRWDSLRSESVTFCKAPRELSHSDKCAYVLSLDRVTIDGVWIGNRIY